MSTFLRVFAWVFGGGFVLFAAAIGWLYGLEKWTARSRRRTAQWARAVSDRDVIERLAAATVLPDDTLRRNVADILRERGAA